VLRDVTTSVWPYSHSQTSRQYLLYKVIAWLGGEIVPFRMNRIYACDLTVAGPWHVK